MSCLTCCLTCGLAVVGCPSAIGRSLGCPPPPGAETTAAERRQPPGQAHGISDNPDFCGGAVPHIKVAGSLSAGRPHRPGQRRTTLVLAGAAGFCALACVLAGCSRAHYGMTRCPAPALVGRAARASDLKLLPGSAPRHPGSTAPADWTCTYIPADQYQRWRHGFHDALSVEIYLFPKKLVSRRLLGTLDGHKALRTGAATVSGHITLAGEQASVALFRTGYGAWTGHRLPDGSYSALAIYLSSRQAPRTAAEFRDELQAVAQVSGLG
jgi:hypothetical protein